MTPDPLSDLLGAVMQHMRPAAIDTAKRVTSELLHDHSLCVASIVNEGRFTLANKDSHWRYFVLVVHYDTIDFAVALAAWIGGTALPLASRYAFIAEHAGDPLELQARLYCHVTFHEEK